MTVTVNPDTYWALLNVLARAPRATTYKCVMTRELKSGPYDGEFRDIIEELPGDEFDQLPWDGEVGDIMRATWTMPVAYSFHTGLGVDEKDVFVSFMLDGGLCVVNPYGTGSGMHAVGRVGVMPDKRSYLDPRNRGPFCQHMVNTEEEMVTEVLKLLTAGGWQDADKFIVQNRKYGEYFG